MSGNENCGTAGQVPARVTAALALLDEQYRRAAGMAHATDAENAVRAQSLALVCARRAGWWAVLDRWTYTAGAGIPLVYGQAAMKAGRAERGAARFWRDTAADWRARAERRPTSDAAGSLCNHHELGISA